MLSNANSKAHYFEENTMTVRIDKAIKFLTDPDYRFLINANKGKYESLPDDEYLKRMFKARLGYEMNLDNPQTFNEKLQWLKLYDRKPIYTTMVDKSAVKDYVAGIIGEKYIIPTIGIWNDAEEISFENLPEQFVLKCTHDSQGIVICKDKKSLDIEAAKRKLNRCLKRDYYKKSREWPYKNVPHRIIAEEYLEDSKSHELSDYKVHSFNGTPKVILVCKNRFSENMMTEDFFDAEWNHLNVRREHHGNCKTAIPKPKEMDIILNLARVLSENIPFVRSDFYIVNEKVYFGELTFSPAGGFRSFIPESFDREMGKWLSLPDIKLEN